MSEVTELRQSTSPFWITADQAPDRHSARRIFLPYAAIQWLCVSMDAALILIAGFVGFAGYQLISGGALTGFETYLGGTLIAVFFYVLGGQAMGIYRLSAIFSPRLNVRQVVINWIVVCLLLSSIAFMMKSGAQFSRGSVISAASIALMLLLCSRWATSHASLGAVSSGYVRGRRVVVVGSRDELSAVEPSDLLQTFGLSEVGRVSFPAKESGGLAITVIENDALQRALDLARTVHAEEIVLSLPWSDSRKMLLFREHLRCCPLPVQLLPDRRMRSLLSNPQFNLKSSFAVEFQRGPLSRTEQSLKRLFDIVGASLALLVFSPIMLMTAVAIKLDSPGPALFRQRRNGFNTEQFVIFKFRSMTVCEDGANIIQAKRGDARMTGIGSLLRRSSIDELPQLFNVLRGDMSLVGPRPHALAHDTYYGKLISDYAFRHHVKPGLTGWAQVNGHRGETLEVEHMAARVDFDLWYINNWSLLLDLRILAKTCVEVMGSRKAF